MRLNDAVALVTGASAGIGSAVASRLSTSGVRVLVHGRDRDRTHAVARAVGGTALVADLESAEQRQDLIAEALEVFGRVDVLVNNAGVGWSGPLTQMSVDKIRRLIEVDLIAPVELTAAVLPGMIDRRRGALCFISSVAGRTGVAGEAIYSAAKAGLDMFAESLRAETAGTGIQVGVVIPGAVSTGFFQTRGRPYQRARPRPVSSAAVADAVIGTIVAGRAETWIPRWLQLAAVVRAIAPGPYRQLAARFGEPVRSV